MKLSWMSFGLLAATLQAAEALQKKRDTPREDLTYKANYFQQKINHFPENGLPYANETFTQRYYFDHSYYKPGGPVYLYIGGETSGPSRFSNLQTGIIQILMKETNGLGVILENRYYGESYPFNSSTTDELAFLSTAQTIADNAYFAQNAEFPGLNCSLTAPGTPWIMYGGSLAGAQTAFSIVTYGDIIYGGIAASAPVEPVVGYPEWYYPIQKYGPQDCVGRINNIIDKFDMLVDKNLTSAVDEFKSLFGLESVKDIRDFAQALVDPIGNPGFYLSSTWQELNWNTSFGSRDFFYFCDNVTNIDAPDEINEVDYVLSNYTNGEPWTGLGNYANYYKKHVLTQCPGGNPNSPHCWGVTNKTYWEDTSNSVTRSYVYTSCTEQGAYIDAPKEGPSLLSRVIDTSYEQQWCTWAFPAGSYNAIPSSPDLGAYTSYGGFNISAARLAFVDGSADVWNELCYHSTAAPAPRRQASDLHPELLIDGAGHHWDSYGILDVQAEPQFVREAHLWEIRTVKKWLRDFGSWKQTGMKGSRMGR
ncbi:serine carboxypeptidase S28-domain-containing protein [Xylariomycetidae sp. FL0641]|nr:serine carboxypeptidase S28-domain-containing protein [Xylariomycetidae sp. FL0641]